ncbi:MAG: PhzF family phenazine biosynthesis protein [Candidatus Rokubacteria bacterium]|nr:PhzF family phenazine biosynthesis protein [Candidatus Rokubacteria bacterium]
MLCAALRDSRGSRHRIRPCRAPGLALNAGLLTATGNVARFQAEQGDFLGRPGRLTLELHVVNGQPARVRVGGQAVTVLAGTIRIP